MPKTKRFEEDSTFVWELEEYTSLNRPQESPQFCFFDGSKWKLVLRTGVFHNFVEEDALYIRRVTSPASEHAIDVTVFLRSANGHQCQKRNQSGVYVADGWDYLIWSIEKRILESHRAELLPNNCLTVLCRLRSGFPLQTDNIEALGPTESLAHLSASMNSLFENADHSDVKLTCGGRTISAHRSILSARSEVFSAMFRHDMMEKREGEVAIEDLLYEDLYELLKYVYSGRLKALTVETALRLYEAADKYAVEPLKAECSVFLRRNTVTPHACDILLLAETHGDDELKNFAVCFLLKNRKFLESNCWRDFCAKHPLLSGEVLLYFIEVSNQWEDFGVILS